MAYASWSVVFGEQPSAAKWNILGTNDSTFDSLLGTYGVRNPYCFRAYGSGSTTLTDEAFVKIAFATEVYDYNNNFASSTYTAPVAGVYHFDSLVIHATVSVASIEAATLIYVNGSLHTSGPSLLPSGVFLSGFPASADILLAANDTVEIYHYQNSNGNEATNTSSGKTWFSGHLVHAV